MMTNKMMSGLFLVVLAMAISARAADEAQAVKQDALAVAADVTNDVDALKAQEQALDLQARGVTQKLMDLTRPLWTARQKAMAEDDELRALTAAIAVKQTEIEKKLGEKYPDLSARMKERDALMRQHAELTARLKDVRKKLDETTIIPAKVEKK